MNSSRFSFLRQRYFWLALLTIGLLLVSALYYFSQPRALAERTATVTRGDLKATVNANARVQAHTSARLAFPLSGLLTKLDVQEGDSVKAGDVLAELDRREVERRVKQAEMSLASRQDELAAAQEPPDAQALEIAQQSLKKAALALAAAQARYKENATDDNRIAQELAQSDYDIARATFERQTRGPSATDLERLQRAVENANIDLQNATDALDETQLKAPFDGVVTEVSAHVNELVGGFSPVISLADTAHLELLAEIDEIDVAEVHEGQAVDLRFDAFPGESVQGKLARLFPAASNERGATVYRAIIALDPTTLKLRPGMGATVNIATIEKKDVLRVPSRAIRNAGSQKIVVVQDGNALRNVVVETGMSDGNQTEIVSGVNEGTVLVIE